MGPLDEASSVERSKKCVDKGEAKNAEEKEERE